MTFLRVATISFLFLTAIQTQAETPLATRGVFAHRGASKDFPENTIVALREAVRLGVHGVEFDVRESKDGHLVLMHDSSVNRTTDGSGSVSKLTLAEIKSLDAGAWKSPKFRGERVPTMLEALNVLPNNVWLNVHVKDREAVEKIAALISLQGRQNQTLMAVEREDIDLVHRVDPAIKTINMTRESNNTKYIDRTIASGADWIQFIDKMGLATAQDVQRAAKGGITSGQCCIDKPKEILGLFNSGIDFVLSNDAPTALEQFKISLEKN